MTKPPSSPKDRQPDPPGARVSGAIRLSRVMLVGGGRDDLHRLDDALRGLGAIAVHAPDLDEARTRLEHDEFDVILLDADQDPAGAFEFTKRLAEDADPAAVILCAAEPTFDVAVRGMQIGAADLLTLPLDPHELGRRVAQAQRRAARVRERRRKLERLTRICRRLSNSRQQAAQQVDEMSGDLASAYQELADHMGQVTLSTEFAALIRQELDVESLLRATLEYILSKSGPTNAAVYLPTGHADFSLGAYVNYDLPKDAAEVLLDHLADALPHRFQDERSIHRFDTPGALAGVLGPTAPWLADSTMLAFACHDPDGRCLAVAALFRNASNAFPAALLPKLDLIRELFNEQLSRIVRLHNRHKPTADWSGFDVAHGQDDEGDGDADDQDWGLAA